MQSSFPELRRRLRSKWLPVEVHDLEDAPAEDLARAERLAGMVKLQPTLTGLGLDRDGRFALVPTDLLLTLSGDRDTAPLDDMEECFELLIVRDAKGIQSLAAALEDRPTDDRWPFRLWLEDALENGRTVIAVDEPGTERPAGFLAYRREANVYAHPEGGVELELRLAPECIYIAPDCRGMRLSSAIRRAVMEDVASDVERIAELTRSPRFRRLGEVAVTFRVTGDAYSPEGEGFLAAATENLEMFVAEKLSHEERARLGCEEVEPDYSV